MEFYKYHAPLNPTGGIRCNTEYDYTGGFKAYRAAKCGKRFLKWRIKIYDNPLFNHPVNCDQCLEELGKERARYLDSLR